MYGIRICLKNTFVSKHSFIASKSEKFGTIMYEGYFCSLDKRNEYVTVYNDVYVPRMENEGVIIQKIEV